MGKHMILALLLFETSARRIQPVRSTGDDPEDASIEAVGQRRPIEVPGQKPMQAQVQVLLQAQTESNPSQQCQKNLDLFFVIGCGLSCSASHSQARTEGPSEALTSWNKMKGFVMHVAQQLAFGKTSTHASVVQWKPQGAEKKCSDVIDEETLLDCLNGIPMESGAAGHVDKALKIVSKMLKPASAESKSADRQTYVIVFVDERNHYGTGQAVNLKKKCGEFSNCIISIAIGDGTVDPTHSAGQQFRQERKATMLKDAQALTGNISENSLKADTYEDLSPKMVQSILDLICPGASVPGGEDAPEVTSPVPIEKPAAVEERKSEENGKEFKADDAGEYYDYSIPAFADWGDDWGA